MSLKFAFAGFRHPHIYALFKRVSQTPGMLVTAAAEDDLQARSEAQKNGVTITHKTTDELLKTCDADIVAVGDYYARRGHLVLEALNRPLHVISDKPLCTGRGELEEIRTLARKMNKRIGCMLDLRSAPNMRSARKAVLEGKIGEIRSVQFNGQHPLNYGTRAGWYFEPGKHGGTINDLAVHALDFIPYVTGLKISNVLAASSRNCAFPEKPFFQTSAQLMFRLENGAGVSGDVSYAAPSFLADSYWRFTLAGTQGLLEFNYNTPGVVFMNSAGEKEILPAETTPDGMDYFDSFLADINGEKTDLNTESILHTAELSLQLQEIAENELD